MSKVPKVISSIGGDFLKVLILVTIAALAGLSYNAFREVPLSFVYETKEQRLAQVTSRLSTAKPLAPELADSVTGDIAPTDNLNLASIQKILQSKNGLILDARPEIFYRLGHIPGAISLPRDDFEAAYLKLKPVLEKDKGQLLTVYCSSVSCEDSMLLRDALIRLGYVHVRRFPGGWAEWTHAGLPEEKNE